MKYLALALAFFLGLISSVQAWDGFDAATTELVEITPDCIPVTGDRVEVREYEGDKTQSYVVETVIRNPRTIEVMARDEQGNLRILVMEARQDPPFMHGR